jgi:hypothetical protein
MSSDNKLPEFLRRKTPEQIRTVAVGRFQPLGSATSVLQCTNLVALATIAAIAVTLFSLQSHINSDRQVIEHLLANAKRLEIAGLLVSIVNAVAFATWTHLAYSNLPALNYTKCTYSPSVAVILLFIPLVNVFVLLRVFNELADGSNPENWPQRSRGPSGPNFLVFAWWLTWLLEVALYVQLVLRYFPLDKAANEIEDYLGYTAWLVVASLIPTALSFLVFGMLAANQQSRHKLVSNAAPAAKATVDMSFLKG